MPYLFFIDVMRKSYKKLIFLLILLLTISVVLNNKATASPVVPPKDSLFHFQKFVMGIEVEFILRDSDETHAQKASESAFAEMARLEGILSNWKENSKISKINRSQAGKWIPVSREIFEVLSKGMKISESTNGAFDLTVGKLTRLWGFYTGEPKKPSKEKLDEALAVVDYSLIELDSKKQALLIKKSGVEIDLGGVAKGYILEKGFEVLKSFGIKAGLINGSGDIYVWGKKPGDKLWNIAVEDPLNRNRPLTILSVTDTAIFSSGDYERKFIEEGKVYHHILDPKTGLPANKCHGVTIIGKSISDINGLSSAVFVLGPEEGISFIEKNPGLSAIVVDADGKVILSKGFKEKHPEARFSR